jgi:hypothetical protein
MNLYIFSLWAINILIHIKYYMNLFLIFLIQKSIDKELLNINETN